MTSRCTGPRCRTSPARSAAPRERRTSSRPRPTTRRLDIGVLPGGQRGQRAVGPAADPCPSAWSRRESSFQRAHRAVVRRLRAAAGQATGRSVSSETAGRCRYGGTNVRLSSRKNGRFSGKNVSKTDRFSTAGSCSTCPKSGLNVADSVAPVPSPIRASSPVAAPPSPARSGSELAASQGIGNQLEPPRRGHTLVEHDVAEERHLASLAARLGDPGSRLALAPDLTLNVEPPDLTGIGRRREAHL